VLHRGDHRVVVNLGSHEACVPLDAEPAEVLAAFGPQPPQASGPTLGLPPESVAVVRLVT
jgi:hypothetical protein